MTITVVILSLAILIWFLSYLKTRGIIKYLEKDPSRWHSISEIFHGIKMKGHFGKKYEGFKA